MLPWQSPNYNTYELSQQVASQSCCVRPARFFPASLSLLLHPNPSPQSTHRALDPPLTRCLVGKHCLYSGVHRSARLLQRTGLPTLCIIVADLSPAHAKIPSHLFVLKPPQRLDPADSMR